MTASLQKAPHLWTAVESVAALKARKIGSLELLEHYLERRARLDGAVNAVVEIRADAALLAGGFLTGKYKQQDTTDTGRLSGANPFGDSKFSDLNWTILATLKDVAVEQNRPPAQVALACVMA